MQLPGTKTFVTLSPFISFNPGTFRPKKLIFQGWNYQGRFVWRQIVVPHFEAFLWKSVFASRMLKVALLREFYFLEKGYIGRKKRILRLFKKIYIQSWLIVPPKGSIKNQKRDAKLLSLKSFLILTFWGDMCIHLWDVCSPAVCLFTWECLFSSIKDVGSPLGCVFTCRMYVYQWNVYSPVECVFTCGMCVHLREVHICSLAGCVFPGGMCVHM
jgi:hypothetical protein